MTARDIIGLVIPATGQATLRTLRVRNGLVLADLQEIVGGFVEHLPVTGERGHAGGMYLNEEGQLRGLPENVRALRLLRASGLNLLPGTEIVGDVVVVGPPDGDGDDTDIDPHIVALAARCGALVPR